MQLDRWEVGAVVLAIATGGTFVTIGALAMAGAPVPSSLTDGARVLLGAFVLYLGAKGAMSAGPKR